MSIRCCDQDKCIYYDINGKHNCSAKNVFSNYVVTWCIGHPDTDKNKKINCKCPSCKVKKDHRFVMMVKDKCLLVCDKCLSTFMFDTIIMDTYKVKPMEENIIMI